MQAAKVFEEMFPEIAWESGRHTLIDVDRQLQPCELSFRQLDDVLAELHKAIDSPAELAVLDRVRAHCAQLGLHSACFAHVPDDYYSRPLEERRRLLAAPRVECLCKSLILENVACTAADCSDPRNSRFFCVCIQYVAQLNSQKVFKFVRSLSSGSRNEFHFRMTSESSAFELTGFEHNAISPFGMKMGLMPIILAQGIAELPTTLNCDFFWLGGGTVDLKLGFRVSEFISKLHPFIADIYK